MELRGRTEGSNVLVLELREDHLDAGNVREFKDLATALIHDRTRVVLDLAGVRFVDSSGLGALIGCLRQLNARQGELVLCEMTQTVRALFELMRMHRVFHIHQSRRDAVRALDPAAVD